MCTTVMRDNEPQPLASLQTAKELVPLLVGRKLVLRHGRLGLTNRLLEILGKTYPYGIEMHGHTRALTT